MASEVFDSATIRDLNLKTGCCGGDVKRKVLCRSFSVRAISVPLGGFPLSTSLNMLSSLINLLFPVERALDTAVIIFTNILVLFQKPVRTVCSGMVPLRKNTTYTGSLDTARGFNRGDISSVFQRHDILDPNRFPNHRSFFLLENFDRLARGVPQSTQYTR